MLVRTRSPRLLAVALILAVPQPGTAQLPGPGTPPDAFTGATEAQLDSLYGPLVYLMQGEERGRYRALDVEGKRAYLRRFWGARDPTTGTPRNEALEDFYGRVATVNRIFAESGAAPIPGWRTDRGRIYLRYGAPDTALHRPQPRSTNPYEVWKYARQQRKFVFFDLTRFGNYALIWSDDVREPRRPNWDELLGREAVEDVLRF